MIAELALVVYVWFWWLFCWHFNHFFIFCSSSFWFVLLLRRLWCFFFVVFFLYSIAVARGRAVVCESFQLVCRTVFTFYLAAAPKTTTDRLQRVLNAAARVVSDTRKFDHGLSRLMHQELHWLDIPERVSYKLDMLTHRCLLGKAPVPVQLLYPGRPSRNTSAIHTLCCTSSADRSATSSQHLRSSGIRCRWSDDVQHSAK